MTAALSWREPGEAPRLIGAAVRLELARRAAAERPGAAPVQYALAAECFHVQDDKAGVAAFERGLSLARPAPDALRPYLRALLARRGPAAMLLAADWLAPSPEGLLALRGEALRRLGQAEAARAALERSLDLRPGDPEAARSLQALLTGARDWAGLVAFAERQAARGGLTAPVITGWISGLTGLGRLAEAAALLDFDKVVRIQTISPPAPFASLAAFNAALANDVRSSRKTRLTGVPRLQMTGGVQVEDLATDSSPAMAALFDLLRCAAQAYIADGVFRGAAPQQARLEAWALILAAGDTQDSHTHPYSSVAGVYYVAAPPALLGEGCEAGCLEIPADPPAPLDGLIRPRRVQPQPGRLVLFPGYVPHRTTPIAGAGERISIAFDVAAA